MTRTIVSTLSALCGIFLLAGMLTGCGPAAKPQTEFSDESPVRYIPSDVAFVMSLDMGRIATLPGLAEGLKTALENEPETKATLDALGVDPLRDLKAVAFGIYAKVTDEDPDTIAAVNLTIDLEKAVALIREKANAEVEVTDTMIGEGKAFEFRKVGDIDGEKKVFAYQATPSIILVANSTHSITDALAAKQNKKSALDTGDLAANIKLVNTTHQFWMLGDGARMKDSRASGIGIIAYSAHYDKGFTMDGAVVLADPAAAADASKQANEGIKQFSPMVIMQAPGLRPLVDNFKVSNSGSQLTMNLALTEDQVKEVAKAFEELAKQFQQ